MGEVFYTSRQVVCQRELYFSFPNSCLGTCSQETLFHHVEAVRSQEPRNGVSRTLVPKQEFGNQKYLGKTLRASSSLKLRHDNLHHVVVAITGFSAWFNISQFLGADSS